MGALQVQPRSISWASDLWVAQRALRSCVASHELILASPRRQRYFARKLHCSAFGAPGTRVLMLHTLFTFILIAWAARAEATCQTQLGVAYDAYAHTPCHTPDGQSYTTNYYFTATASINNAFFYRGKAIREMVLWYRHCRHQFWL